MFTRNTQILSAVPLTGLIIAPFILGRVLFAWILGFDEELTRSITGTVCGVATVAYLVGTIIKYRSYFQRSEHVWVWALISLSLIMTGFSAWDLIIS